MQTKVRVIGARYRCKLRLMRRKFISSALVLAALAAVVLAQDQGVQAVVGNVFLQDTTPGNPQIGHAAIKGTFRAGQVFVQQGTGTTTPVVGNNTATGAGFSNGGSFSSAQESGTGVRGTGTAVTGITTGVYGETRSKDGRGVVGQGKAGGLGVFGVGKYGVYGNGTLNGVIGQVSGANGSGVDAVSTNFDSPGLLARNTAGGLSATFQSAIDVRGNLFLQTGSGRLVGRNSAGRTCIEATWNDQDQSGIMAIKPDSGAYAYMTGTSNSSRVEVLSKSVIQAQLTANSSGQGVITADVKNFVQPDPDNEERDIAYACVEGPEAAAYIRGTGRLVNGVAKVTLPRHFQNVSVAEGMTIQLTPKSADSEGLAVVSESLAGFEVRELRKGHGTYEFNWEVKAVRRGFTDYKVYRSWEDMAPHDMDRAKAKQARRENAQNVYGIQYRSRP